MNSPSVCAILLTADRPAMTKRAVESFRAQTYENKRLLIVNSGLGPLVEETDQIQEPCFIGADALSIGELRNLGNRYASHHYVESWKRPEIFIHWDSDDYSHPNRISEQVAFLQSSGADVVGYSDLLLWQEPVECATGNGVNTKIHPECVGGPAGLIVSTDSDGAFKCEVCPKCRGTQYVREPEAYLYTARDAQFAPGTSLCYWRRTWEAKPFPDISQGEDYEWLQNLKLARKSSVGMQMTAVNSDGDAVGDPFYEPEDDDPRMIASIHAGNTSTSYNLLLNGGEQAKHYMRRVRDFDSYCRERMTL